ncbi:MAG: hypothetical protein DCC71_19840 [Proteobacteria bacterium]|nr:MAG: hypothetical protein DCC71_19840 [Pseudomonadota bacterium]
MFVALAAHAHAQDEPPAFEKPPELHAQDVASGTLLEGPGFLVEDAAPTDGFLARFTIRADVGVFEAHGADTLAVRVAEIQALRALDRAVQTSAFAEAVEKAAERAPDAPALGGPGNGVGSAPGIGRFFGAAAAADPAQRDKALRGHEQEVREIARRLGVDPYTTHPVLAAKLRDVAWISFVGGARRDGLLPSAAPERVAVPGSGAARARVYDTPRGELVAKNAERMRALGASDEVVRALGASRAVSLSAQTALVEALGRIPDAQGRGDVLAFASELETADQALFLVRAIGVLADRHEQGPLAELRAGSPIVARQQSGQVVAVAPADTLAWTQELAAFARREDLAAPQRAFWISGRATSRARTELESLGWVVHEGVKP